MSQNANQNQSAANNNSHTVVMLMLEDELSTCLTSAKGLLKLSAPEREIALNQIKSNHTQPSNDASRSPGLIGFLKEAFTFPDRYNQAILAKESPDCDKACAHMRRDERTVIQHRPWRIQPGHQIKTIRFKIIS